jgi:hypothetical protein
MATVKHRYGSVSRGYGSGSCDGGVLVAGEEYKQLFIVGPEFIFL